MYLVFALLLFGIFRSTNGYCEVSEKRRSCCTEAYTYDAIRTLHSNPMFCAFLTPSEISLHGGDFLHKNQKCECIPVFEYDFSIFSLSLVSSCQWNPSYYNSTKQGTVIPCLAYYKDSCGLSTTSAPAIDCYIGYPPPAKVMHRFDDKYCNFKNPDSSDLKFLPEEMIYDVFFTCWLYNCGNRLEKPKETRDMRDKLQWCYPPVLPADKRLEYCELYTSDTNFYVAAPFSPSNEPPKNPPPRITGKLCVLPPVCKEGELRTDQNLYMLSWVSEKADPFYCEVLCSEIGPNNGRTPAAEPCRRLPSCYPNGRPDERNNLYQVPKCRHWCSEADSYERSHAQSNCNPIPICMVVGGEITNMPQEAYTEGNPFAHTSCIPPRQCRGTETPDTHYCTAGPLPPGPGTVAPPVDGDGKDTVSPGQGIIAAVLLLLVCIGVIVFIVLRKRRRPSIKEKTEDLDMPPSITALSSSFESATPNTTEPTRPVQVRQGATRNGEILQSSALRCYDESNKDGPKLNPLSMSTKKKGGGSPMEYVEKGSSREKNVSSKEKSGMAAKNASSKEKSSSKEPQQK